MASKNILVVDDEEIVLKVTVILLQKAGFTVESFPDGYAVLDFIKNNPNFSRTLLIDNNMPGPTGPQTIDKIREFIPDIRAIVMSGSVQQDEEADLRKNTHGFHFLKKPFTAEELLAAVRKIQ